MKHLGLLLRRSLRERFDIFFHLRRTFAQPDRRKKLFGALFLTIVLGFYYWALLHALFIQVEMPTLASAVGALVLGLLGVHVFFFLISFAETMAQTNLKNARVLSRLPIAARTVFASDVLMGLGDVLFLWAIVVPPVLIRTAQQLRLHWWYYAVGVVGSLLALVLFKIVMMAFSMGLLRLAQKRRIGKSAVQVFTIVIGLGVGIGFNIAFQTMNARIRAGSMTVGAMFEKLTNDALKFLPHLRPLVDGLRAPSFLVAAAYTLLLAGLCVLALWLLSRIFARTYLSFALEGNVRRRSRRVSSAAQAEVKTPAHAIFSMEWQQLRRHPIWLYNYIGPALLMPLMVWISLRAVRTNHGAFDARSLGAYMQDWPVWVLLSIGYIAGWIIAFFFSQSSSSTALSRHGKSLWRLQSLPIRARDFVRGVCWMAGVLRLVAILPMVFLVMYYVTPPWEVLLSFLAGYMITGSVIGRLNLLLDLWSPRFTWTREQELSRKGSLVSICAMALGIAQIYTFVMLSPVGMAIQTIALGLATGFAVVGVVGAVLLQRVCEWAFGQRLSQYSAQ